MMDPTSLRSARALTAGQLRLFDYDVPGLTAGAYTITVELSLPNDQTDHFHTATTQRVRVEGPQFSLDTSEIHSIFPDRNTNGDFSRVLPSIVLENPALPWERVVAEDRTTPWLALLALGADEIDIDSTTGSATRTKTVREFLAPETGIVKPRINAAALSSAVLDSSLSTLRITTDTFRAITPRLGELAFLTHVRQIASDGQTRSNAAPDDYSVVVANRFPKSANSEDDSGATNHLHLVSIEGLVEYLVEEPAWPAGARYVELVSLTSWPFTSVAKKGQTFADLATDLVTAAAGDPDRLLLRLDAGSASELGADRLRQGYTALETQTVIGVDTFSWFRGPFTAMPAQPLPTEIPIYHHPSQAAVYDETHAIFDNSYAAAWTIGRLAVLADPAFVALLQHVRTRIIRLCETIRSREGLRHLRDVATLEELVAPGVTRRAFERQVVAGLATDLDDALHERGDSIGSATASARALASSSSASTSTAAHRSMRPLRDLRAVLGSPEVRAFLRARVAGDLQPLAAWLARLATLNGVPFDHLVPDQRMLPAESVRFFHVDQGWIRVLLDGASTIGLHTSRDLAVHTLIAADLYQAVLRNIRNPRRRAHPDEIETTTSDGPAIPAAGMLIRSSLVAGWPGLTIGARNADGPVEALRIDHLSPSTLLVLWPVTPTVVSISEPHQSLAFGTDARWMLERRSLVPASLGAPLGQTFPAPGQGDMQQFMRSGFGERVVKLIPPPAGSPAGYFVPALSAAFGVAGSLSPSQVAIQLFKVPEQLRFERHTDAD